MCIQAVIFRDNFQLLNYCYTLIVDCHLLIWFPAFSHMSRRQVKIEHVIAHREKVRLKLITIIFFKLSSNSTLCTGICNLENLYISEEGFSKRKI